MRRRVGALIFDGFEMLDLYGPLEMYAMHPDAFEIVTVGQDGVPKAASGGPQTVPQASFDDACSFDILLVPGGPGTRQEVGNPVVLSWLQDKVKSAEIVTSVCTGAVLLAKAGLLAGHDATTNKQAFDWVVAQAPDVAWQPVARWVESGGAFTSSGVSAGIDMTLAVIARCIGGDRAEEAAIMAEYIRNRDPDQDPFAVVGQT